MMTLHNYVQRNAVNDKHFARVNLDPNLYMMDSDVNEEGSTSNDDAASDMARVRHQIALSLENV